jgi:hypothetical protein
MGRCTGLYSTLYLFRFGVGGRSISTGVAAGVTGREVSADPIPLLRLVYLRLAVGAGLDVEAVGSILIGGGAGLLIIGFTSVDGPAWWKVCDGPVGTSGRGGSIAFGVGAEAVTGVDA